MNACPIRSSTDSLKAVGLAKGKGQRGDKRRPVLLLFLLFLFELPQEPIRWSSFRHVHIASGDGTELFTFDPQKISPLHTVETMAVKIVSK